MIFVSLFTYTAVKIAGTAWPRIQQAELADPASSAWPGFRALGELAHVGENLTTYIDGSTLITKARSRAAGFFLKSDADVWVTFDDDCYADRDVLQTMVAAARETRGLVALPYTHRDGGARRTFESGPLEPSRIEERESASLYRAPGGVGLGLAAIHRSAVETTSKHVPRWRPDNMPGESFPGLFLERIEEGLWIGEDIGFGRLCQKCGVPVYLVLDAPCSHVHWWSMLRSDLHTYVGEERARCESRRPPPKESP